MSVDEYEETKKSTATMVNLSNIADSKFVRKLEKVFALQTKHLTIVTPYPVPLDQRLLC